jgi:hypothetical protein
MTSDTLFDPKTLSAIPRGLAGSDLQLGCVVRDFESAIRQWSSFLNVGPWIVISDFPNYERIHRGQIVDVQADIAFTYFGDVQLEFIHQRNDAPSPYREFLASGREGLQHFGFFTKDFAGATRAVRAAKLEPVYVTGPKGAVNKTTYYEISNSANPMIEVIDLTPQRIALYGVMKSLGKNWDGAQPVRRYASMSTFAAEHGIT